MTLNSRDAGIILKIGHSFSFFFFFHILLKERNVNIWYSVNRNGQRTRMQDAHAPYIFSALCCFPGDRMWFFPINVILQGR